MYIFAKSGPLTSWRQKIDLNITTDLVKFKVKFIATSQESSANNFLLRCQQQHTVILKVATRIVCLLEYTFCP